MGALKDMLEAIGTAATNSVLRERLTLFVDEAQRLEKENEELKERVAGLERQIADATEKLAESRKAEEFVEHEGALFKRGPGGDYIKAVYCPVCKTSTASQGDASPFTCHRCRWVSSFLRIQLHGVMKRLPG